MLQTAATTLHLSTEAARTAFNVGYYIDSTHNLFKINLICRKPSCSATGAALLCCEFFLLLIVSRLYHTLFCFCLDGSCLWAFSAFHCLKAIWINATSHLNPNIQLKRLFSHSRMKLSRRPSKQKKSWSWSQKKISLTFLPLVPNTRNINIFWLTWLAVFH